MPASSSTPPLARSSSSSSSSKDKTTTTTTIAASTATPQVSRRFITFATHGQPDAPPATPTEVQIMTESCDWCLTEAPWDDTDLFGNENLDDSIIETPSLLDSTPKGEDDGDDSPSDQVNLRPRQALAFMS